MAVLENKKDRSVYVWGIEDGKIANILYKRTIQVTQINFVVFFSFFFLAW